MRTGNENMFLKVAYPTDPLLCYMQSPMLFLAQEELDWIFLR